AEDGGLVLAQLLGDTGHDGVKLLARRGDGVLEARYLAGKGRRVQVMGLALCQHLIDTVGPRDDHAGRDRHAFKHAVNLTWHRAGVNQDVASRTRGKIHYIAW